MFFTEEVGFFHISREKTVSTTTSLTRGLVLVMAGKGWERIQRQRHL